MSIAQHNLEDNEVYLFYINLMIHNFTHMLLINPALNCTKVAISARSVRPERKKSEAV